MLKTKVRHLPSLSAALTIVALSAACVTLSHKGENSFHVINGFETPADIERAIITDGFTAATLNRDPAFIQSGSGSLALAVQEGAIAGLPVMPTPRVDFHFEEPIPLDGFKGLEFYFYVPPHIPQHLFGRHDIRIILNGGEESSHADPSTTGDVYWAAAQAGWNHYRWEFLHFNELDTLRELTIRLGPLMEGFGEGTFYLDSLRLIPADPLDSGALDFTALLDDPSWSRRYQAVMQLAEVPAEEALPLVLAFTADPARVVRHRAVKTMQALVQQLGADAWMYLAEGLESDAWHTRLTILQLLARTQDRFGEHATAAIRQGLFDPNYYIREFCLENLLAGGESHASIAASLVKTLPQSPIPALRLLSEMRATARAALPDVLNLLRNTDAPLKVRQWALCAAWQIDEVDLTPADWLLGLSLNPNEIHRHLLNRSMQRLEQADEAAIPVLMAALTHDDPRVRGRSAVLLGAIGAADAIPALQKKVDDPVEFVAAEATYALTRISGTAEPEVESSAKGAPPVVVTEDAKSVTFRNGLVEMVFLRDDDNPGPAEVRLEGGPNLVDADWLPTILAFRFSNAPSMIERQWLQRLFGSPFPRTMEARLVSATDEAAHYAITFVPQADNEPLEWEYHYMLRRGESGFYTWINVRNVSGELLEGSDLLTANIGIGRYTYLLGLTWGLFDTAYLHDNIKGPARFSEFSNQALVDRWPDIYQSAFRTPDGNLYAKHEWENYHYISHVNGYTGPHGGFWKIYPSLDFFGDSMPRHQATCTWGNLFVPHWEGKYYSNVTPLMTPDWQKTYGPIMIYLNEGGCGETLWADAKRQARAEKSKWPFDWLEAPGFHERGSVSGRAVLEDGSPAAGGYVILSNPNEAADPGQLHLWMRNAGPYQYWTEVAADGSFEIPNVRAGSYRIDLMKPGIYGEAGGHSIKIETRRTTDVGTLTLVPISKGVLIWQIGIPDGGPMEFRNGNNFHQWETYTRYREDFPQDVHYIVGQSDWTRDWNYVHPAAVLGEDEPIRWTIQFELGQAPSGEYLFTVVCGGRHNPVYEVLLNGEKVGVIDPKVGWHHIRTCPIGEQALREIVIPAEKMRQGTNTLVLAPPAFDAVGEQVNPLWYRQWSRYIAYDFLRLEQLK